MMMRSILTAFAAMLIFSTTVHAGHVGSLTRDASGWYGAIGYENLPANWDAGGVSFDVTQNQLYAEGGKVFDHGIDVKARFGLADWKAGGAFSSGENADGGFMPFVAAGAAVPLFRNRYLQAGPYVEGTFFTYYEDSGSTVTRTIGATTYTGTEKLTFDSLYELETGVKFETVMEGARLYFGPAFYYSSGQVTYRISTFKASSDIELAKSVGGFAGIRWKLDDALSLELEGKVRDNLVVGGTLSYQF